MESYFGKQEVQEQKERTAELKVQEKSDFNFELNRKEIYFTNLLILSKPEKTRLKYAETRCIKGEHTIKMIELFTVQSKECPLHHSELAKTANHLLMEVYTFYVKTPSDDRLTIFVPSDKLNLKLDIYNRINVRGFDSDIRGKGGNGVFGIGVFVDPANPKLSSNPIKQIELYEEEASSQKSMLKKEDVIEQFGIDIPKLNLSDEAFSAYKHGLLLTTVHSGINILAIGNPGCVIGDERIIMGDGTISKIQELGQEHLQNINLKVQIGKGTNTEEAKTFFSYAKQPVIEIITETGKSIKGTYNHPLLIATKKCIGKQTFKNRKTGEYFEADSYRASSEWRRLDELKIGDKVKVISSYNCYKKSLVETKFMANVNKLGHKSKGILPKYVTPSLGGLFGYIIGDGWHVSKYQLGMIVADDEKDLIKPLNKAISENFGIKAGVYSHPPNSNKFQDRIVNRTMITHNLIISNHEITQNLIFLKDKRVPEMILKSPNSVVSEFIKWVFTADGTILKIKAGERKERFNISLVSIHLELLRDIQLLLLRWGIHSRICAHDKTGNAYGLFINRRNSVLSYNKNIGFACEKKIKKLKEAILSIQKETGKRFGRQSAERIVKINKGEIANVYDIEVPEGHRFVANGIISHNSFKSSIGLEMRELSGGAYVDSTLATGAGIIGTATRDYQGHHLEGGIIFSARNQKGKSGKVLILDELDKMVMANSFFLKPLNGILANHHLSYNKANIRFDDDFYTSFIGFGNPIYGRFQGVPYNEIMQTFRNEKTFISRMHLIFALRCSNPDPTTVREYDMNSLKVYLNQARNMKVTEKDIEPEAKIEMQKLYSQNTTDERYYSKLKDLCIAEAKFSLHNKVTLQDVKEIERILTIAKEMQYART